jgi:iron complex outermembrane recepter protein
MGSRLRLSAGQAAGLAVVLLGTPALGAQLDSAAADVVVVTGERSGEAVSDTVLPVTRIDQAAIIEIGAQHPAELLSRAPGVMLNRGNGAEHLTAIRSPVLAGGAGAGSFLYLEDGIPLRAAGFANVNGLFESLSNLAGGIEVVRGPGSALQGSNALHGVINFLTPAPDQTATLVEAELGSFGRARGQLRASRAGERTSALIAIAGQHEDGWRAEAGLDRVEALVRLDGETPRFDWRATASMVTLNQETAGYVGGFEAYRDLALARSNNDPEAFRDAMALRMALALSGTTGSGRSWQVTPYLRANEMDFLMHFVPSEALEESNHASAGIQASVRTLTDWGSYTLGTDLERTRGALRETQSRPTIFSFVQGDHYDYSVRSDVAALYGQTRWQLLDSFRLQAGLRLEHVTYDYDNALADNAVGRFLRVADREDSYDLVLPHLGASWQLDADSAVIARLARGARAPQTTELYRLQPGQVIEGIEPETLDSLEIGYRRDAGGPVSYSVTAFAMQKRNVFFRDADGFNVTDGRTRHHGVELTLDYAVSPKLTLAVAGSWSEHSYDFDQPVTTPSEVIRSGARIDTAPDWLWNARLNWVPSDSFTGSLEWVYVGSYYTDAANLNRYDGHDLVNLRARYRIADGVEVFGAVRNLLDTRYAERADFAFGNDRYFPGEERGVSVGIRVRR